MKALAKIGSDPEVFVTKNGMIVPSVGLVGGRKKSPKRIAGSKIGLGVLEDNVTVELNPRAYAFTARLDCGKLVETMNKELASFLKELGLGYQLGSGHTFTAADLATPQAQEMGCDPDYLAHQDGAYRPALHPLDVGNNRYAAGHIHVGYDASIIPRAPMVQLIEALAYMPLLHLDKQMGKGSCCRRIFYGRAGLYRPTAYGVEWRTPSNFWLDGKAPLLEEVGKVATALLKKPDVAASVYRDIESGLAVPGRTGWQLIEQIITCELEPICVHSYRKRLAV
jgi:hypothetical protein